MKKSIFIIPIIILSLLLALSNCREQNKSSEGIVPGNEKILPYEIIPKIDLGDGISEKESQNTQPILIKGPPGTTAKWKAEFIREKDNSVIKSLGGSGKFDANGLYLPELKLHDVWKDENVKCGEWIIVKIVFYDGTNETIGKKYTKRTMKVCGENNKPNNTSITVPKDTTTPVISVSIKAKDDTGISDYCVMDLSDVQLCPKTPPNSCWKTVSQPETDFSKTENYTLSGNSKRRVCAYFRDPSGNISEPTSDSVNFKVTADTIPPTLSNANVVKSSEIGKVSVSFTAEDDNALDGYCIVDVVSGTQPTIPQGSDSCWQNAKGKQYQGSNISHTLANTGKRTVYIWVRDTSNNTSHVSKEVDFSENQNPIGILEVDKTTTQDPTVRLTVSGSDNTGISGYMIKEEPSIPKVGDKEWVPVSPAVKSFKQVINYTFTAAKTYTIYMWLKDGSGNISKEVHVTVKYTPQLKENEYTFENCIGSPAQPPGFTIKGDFTTFSKWLTVGDVGWSRYLKAVNISNKKMSLKIENVRKKTFRIADATVNVSTNLYVPAPNDFDFYNTLGDLSGDVMLHVSVDGCDTKSIPVLKKPYGELYTWRDLQNMSLKLDGSYKIMNDITYPIPGNKGFPAANGHTPVGTGDKPFSGSLDGQNKTIDKLFVKSGANDVGLFGYVNLVTTPQSVKDIIFTNPVIAETNSKDVATNIGVIAGVFNGEKLTGITVKNGTVSVSGNSSSTAGGIAGILATAGSGETVLRNINTNIDCKPVRNCGGIAGNGSLIKLGKMYSTGNVTAEAGDIVGGLFGLLAHSTVYGFSTGEVKNTLRNSGLDLETGGLVGRLNRSNLYGFTTGNVTVADSVPASNSPYIFVGGAIGIVIRAQTCDDIERTCKNDFIRSHIRVFATGNVSAANNKTVAGGLIGAVNFEHVLNTATNKYLPQFLGYLSKTYIQPSDFNTIWEKDYSDRLHIDVSGYAKGTISGGDTAKTGGLIGNVLDGKISGYSMNVPPAGSKCGTGYYNDKSLGASNESYYPYDFKAGYFYKSAMNVFCLKSNQGNGNEGNIDQITAASRTQETFADKSFQFGNGSWQWTWDNSPNSKRPLMNIPLKEFPFNTPEAAAALINK